jgi:hypothetical protein
VIVQQRVCCQAVRYVVLFLTTVWPGVLMAADKTANVVPWVCSHKECMAKILRSANLILESVGAVLNKSEATMLALVCLPAVQALLPSRVPYALAVLQAIGRPSLRTAVMAVAPCHYTKL